MESSHNRHGVVQVSEYVRELLRPMEYEVTMNN